LRWAVAGLSKASSVVTLLSAGAKFTEIDDDMPWVTHRTQREIEHAGAGLWVTHVRMKGAIDPRPFGVSQRLETEQQAAG
jgi:hypothetical protein